MYELIQVSKTAYYLQSPAKIGIVRLNDSDVYLIDSGNNKDAGKRALRVLGEQGWNLKAIFNTHSHADHIGGNAYLQAQTGCKIYAAEIECGFINDPILEPTVLYGGYPCSDLRHKFLMAEKSHAEPLTKEVLPDGWEIVPLPGHCLGMIGFRTSDDVVYVADSLSSAETLEKYGICFLYDIESSLKTLDELEALSASYFIPSHAPAAKTITDLVRCNREKILEITDRIVSLCEQPIGFEELLSRLFAAYGLRMNFEQHELVGSTVRSYLAWLKDAGHLAAEFDRNRLLWKAVSEK